ncbi:MAG: ATP-binding protein [Phycisphaerales bacterium]|jgi:MinD superfamily P-loop ATPase
MKEIVVISGKGGTGKTSIVASFAALAKEAVLADCDVDAADLHLILKPDVKEAHDFSGGKKASVITEKCIGCGRCDDVCEFDAPELKGPANDVIQRTYRIDSASCEGCGVCTHFCPVDAIEFKEAVNGRWFISDTRFGPMVHARLGIGEENSGKLVSLLRQQAKALAQQQNKKLLIVDGSPGIGCPVIASITGADIVLIVTEPTLSGEHDLLRVAKLTEHFKIPAAVCINKCDINSKVAGTIAEKAKRSNLPVLGQIPYDNQFTQAQIEAKSIIEFSNGSVKEAVESVWQKTLQIVGAGKE